MFMTGYYSCFADVQELGNRYCSVPGIGINHGAGRSVAAE
jgi:hypothetical protein